MRFYTDCIEKVPKIKRPKFGLTIMVAGEITGFGKTPLMIVDQGKTIDALEYASSILPNYLWSKFEDDLFPNQDLATFQQDGATCHTQFENLGKICEFYEDNIWLKGIWPGSSPNLNLIENVWSVLNSSVFVNPRPTNRRELIERAVEIWESIPTDYLENLYSSFPRRIEQVLQRVGEKCDY